MPMTRYLVRRRRDAAAAWDLHAEIVLIGAGEEIPIPGYGDQVYPFRAHSEYFYLTDRERPGCVLAYDPGEGWVDFVPRVTADERVWMGGGSDEGVPASELGAWLEARRGRPLGMLGCPVPGIEADEELSLRLREQLTQARRPKDEEELGRMRKAAAATAVGFETAAGLIRPGLSERAVQIELEAQFFHQGAERTAYGTIVGSGPNSAVLHFAPTRRELLPGEVVLIDAGAECQGYAADVTRTYPVDGEFSPEMKDLYQVVLETEERGIRMCRAGIEYRDVHLSATLDIARGLVDMGILRGDPESLVERDAPALFFPHGIGHMVGLGVRDASGYAPGRSRSDRPGLRFLRVDLPLEPGYVMTIEPGVYFIPALLEDSKLRERHRDDVNWSRVDGMLDCGGIRIEDDVLVTDGEPEILTAAIPKQP